MRLPAVALGCGIAVLCSVATARSERYYCPWSDGVVELEFGADGSSVQLLNALYLSKGRRTIQVEKFIRAETSDFFFGLLPFDDKSSRPTVYRFLVTDNDYAYFYIFHTDLAVLANMRVNVENGKTFRQWGHCLSVD